MTRLFFVAAGAICIAGFSAAVLRTPARAAEDACATPACVPVSLASSLTVPGTRNTEPAAPTRGSQEWIVDLNTRTYFDANCAAAAELEPDHTMRMRFERTLIDLDYRRSDEPGC